MTVATIAPPSDSGGGAGPGGGSSLERRTKTGAGPLQAGERARWMASAYPGVGDVTIVPAPGGGPREVDPEKEPDRDENARRAARRAMTEMRRYCVANRLDHLVTMTYAKKGGEWDPAMVTQDVDRFVRRLRELLGRSFAYAYVLEWHPGTEENPLGHGLHVHLAHGSFVKHSVLASAWGLGIVDVRWLAKRTETGADKPDRFAAAQRAALYLTKYLAKSFEDEGEFGRHRYRTARGFKPERVVRYFATLDDALTAVVGDYGGRLVWTSREAPLWAGPLVLLVQFDPPPDP